MSVLLEALRSLLSHPLRAALTALSVAFGAAALYVLLSYASGVPDATASLLRSMGSKEFIADPRRTSSGGGGSRRGREIRVRYTDLPAIQAACPSIEGMAPTYRPGRGGPVFSANRSWPWAALVGVGYDYAEVTDLQITEGRWFSKEEELTAREVCLITRPLMEGMFEGRSPLGEFIDAWGRRFEIIGVMQSNSNFRFSMIVPYPTAMQMGDTGGRYVSSVAFAPRSAKRAREAIGEMRQALGALYSFDPMDERAVRITENADFVERVEATSFALQVLVITIALLALVLGCLGAANVVGIAVSERTGELGLRRALGATRDRLRAEVLVENLVLSLAGGAAGVLLGLATTRILGPVEFTEQASIVPELDRTLLAVACGVLIVTAVLAGVPAANRAGRVDPAEALRSA